MFIVCLETFKNVTIPRKIKKKQSDGRSFMFMISPEPTTNSVRFRSREVMKCSETEV